jgi:hypothetical protein
MSLSELIQEAFAEVPYPGDDRIADHDCPECEEVREYFRGKRWCDLQFPELRDRSESLPLLTPEAFRYFLPGYMLATLANWDEADMIPYGIIAIGGHPGDTPERKEAARKILNLFTPVQRQAVAAYLEELARNGPRELRGDPDITYAVAQLICEG